MFSTNSFNALCRSSEYLSRLFSKLLCLRYFVKARSFRIHTQLSTRYLILVAHFINHNNSCMIAFRNTFLVVKRGNHLFRSYLTCAPNILLVPTQVLSSLSVPLSIMCFSKSGTSDTAIQSGHVSVHTLSVS